MNKPTLQIVYLLFLQILPFLSICQIEIVPLQSKELFIIEAFKNKDISVKKINTSGRNQGFGLFRSSDSIIPFDSGLVLSTGNVLDIATPNLSPSRSGVHNSHGNHVFLYPIAKQTTYDGVMVEIDFIPKKEIITFNYLFGSEEYPEYVGSPFNDVFAFHLFPVGKVNERANLATLPTNGAPITVNSINDKKNSDFFLKNYETENISTIEFDGLTKPLMALARVEPGKKHTLVISLADAADNVYDSGVFIEFGSFKSVTPNEIKDDYQAYTALFDEVKNKVDQVFVESEVTPNSSSNSSAHPYEIYKADSLVILFAFDQYTLSDSAILELSLFVEQHPKRKLKVTAHTDSIGTNNYNLLLSEKRAQTTQKWLDDKGIKSTIFWHGLNKPFTSNSSSKGRSLNRRVVIRLE